MNGKWNFLKFNVTDLLLKPLGASQSFEFEGDLEFEEFKFLEKAHGKIELMKNDKGIYLFLNNFTVAVEAICGRSLKAFKCPIFVENEECQFLYPNLKNKFVTADIQDLYLLDMKMRQIDATEFLRQQIILHFPANPVCSDGLEELFDDKQEILRLKRFSGSEFVYSSEDEPSEPENKSLAKLKDLITKKNG